MAADDGPEPAIARTTVQNVIAVNGFAYGVVGADVHVFGSGLPLYLLANWPARLAADPGWLRELPSRMLNARREVVPFTGRDGDLARLRAWRDSGPRLAVRWLYGAGGQGKTRLAGELAAESADAGWKVIAAYHGPDADRPEPGSQDLRTDGAAGLLLIVDYADRWLLTNLTWLLKNALLHQADVQARVLMVARTSDAWPAVRGILDTYQAGTSSHQLEPLPGESGDRTRMFTAAWESFAAIYQLRGALPAGQLTGLTDPEFGLVLALHMAALAAVDGLVRGRQPPSDVAGLSIYLLDRERLHWARLYADGTAQAAAAGAYRTPPGLMNHAVFTAALTGPVPRTAGLAVLEDLGLPDPWQVLGDHAVCYPPSDPGQGTVLEPLYPDRLSEDFLALTVPGHAADYPAQAWATASVTALLAPGSTPAWTSRAVNFLAAAAQRWPHVGPGCLYPLLLADPQLAVSAGSAALATVSGLPDVQVDVLTAIGACLPEHRHADLDPGIAVLTQRVAEFRLAKTTDPAQAASIHADLGIRYYNAGLREEAMAATQESVTLYRRLADADPAGSAAGLAKSLNDLGVRLSQLGRRGEALEAAEEAVQIWRHLAQADPATGAPNLAAALDNLGIRLSELGQREEALAASAEAVTAYQRLTQVDPAAFGEGLAGSLSNMGVRLWDSGRREDALAAAADAVAAYQRLAEINPPAVEPDLVAALSNLAVMRSGLGQREEALTAGQEAAALYRRLARGNPVGFEPGLASALANLAGLLSGLERREDALAAAEEATMLYRRLARANPAFEPGLAASLTNLAGMLSRLGRPEDALAASRDAAEVYQRLAGANPAAFEADLAACLSNLATGLSGVGRPEEALAAIRPAVDLRRRLARANPEAFEPGLAASLTNLATILSAIGQPEQALAAIEEATAIRRRLAQASPDTYTPDLAACLDNRGIALAGLGRQRDAVAAAQEAVTLYQPLAQANPEVFGPRLAQALSNLSTLLSPLGRREEALAAAHEAVALYQPLAQASPSAFEPGLAGALDNLGIHLAGLGLIAEALSACGEAAAIRRRLAQAHPGVFDGDLATTLANLGIWLSRLGRPEEALTVTQEAVGIRRRLAAAHPGAFDADLAVALSNLSVRLSGSAGTPRRRPSPAKPS